MPIKQKFLRLLEVMKWSVCEAACIVREDFYLTYLNISADAYLHTRNSTGKFQTLQSRL